MRVITTKEFGGELKLTKLISEEFMKGLLESINIDSSDLIHKAESRDMKGMRPDIISSDDKGNVILVTECQDQNGKLDWNHFNKTISYLVRNDCLEGILLCESVGEDIRDEVKSTNNKNNYNFSLHIVQYRILQGKVKPFVVFTNNYSPSTRSRVMKANKSNAESGITRQAKIKYSDEDYYEVLDGMELHHEYGGHRVNIKLENGLTRSWTDEGDEFEGTVPTYVTRQATGVLVKKYTKSKSNYGKFGGFKNYEGVSIEKLMENYMGANNG